MNTISIFTFGALILFLLQLTKHLVIPIIINTRNNLPPSPPSLPIIGHVHHLKKPLCQSLAQLAARHGPILLLRFGTRPVLVVSSSALAEECFTTNDIAFANRPKLPSTKLISYNYTVISTRNYGPKWREMGRIATIEALSTHRLAAFTHIRAEEARYLARRLFRETAGGGGFSKVELKSRLYGLTINGLMRVMVGKRRGGGPGRRGVLRRRRIECRGLSSGGDRVVFEAKCGEEVGRNSLVYGWGMAGIFFAYVARTVRMTGKNQIQRGLYLANTGSIHQIQPVFRQIQSKSGRKFAFGVRTQKLFVWQGLVDERRMEGEEGRNCNKTMLDAILSLQKEQPDQYSDTFIKSLFIVSSSF